MAVSEGELYLLDQQLPALGWDNRAVGTRQRWVVLPSLHRREVPNDAREQFIRNTLIKDRPPYNSPIPGTPGSAVENQGWDWNLLQACCPLET